MTDNNVRGMHEVQEKWGRSCHGHFRGNPKWPPKSH